jgi:hypothetical protein
MLFLLGANTHSDVRVETGGLPGRARQWLRILLPVVSMAGCDSLPALTFGDGASTAAAASQSAAPPAIAAPATQDPLGTFAAAAGPGSETVLSLPGGGTQRVRVQRTYFAASGRECRELLLGAGMGERSTLVCQDETGAWVAARPLLGSGGGRSLSMAGPRRP